MMKIFKKLCAISLGLCLLAGFTACQSHTNKVDEKYIDPILGEYQVVSQEVDGDEYVGTWWHLAIAKQDKDTVNFSIYDNEAGNPGIEGTLESLDQDHMSLKYDPDYYDELPSALWKTDGDYLNMTYKVTDTGIELTNNNKTLTFTKQIENNE